MPSPSYPILARTSRISCSSAPRLLQLTQTARHLQSTHHHPQTTKHTNLEVERKFQPTATSLHLLANNAGSPKFTSLERNPTSGRRIEDLYFDTPSLVLMNQGIYVRRRNGCLEAKLRVGGDYVRSAFSETRDAAEILAAIARHVPQVVCLDEKGGKNEKESLESLLRGRGSVVKQVAGFVTVRSEYTANGRFSIVIDEMDFGHRVGEVELERHVASLDGEDHHAQAEAQAEAATQMGKEIDGFMRVYSWAFPAGEDPVGKLAAYFSRGRDGHL
ncbi:hypothetical protein M406DRAFT_68851 [Cryphonectria parasitica EP155]|uniref:CYTH domain-containing protein n=1 Tax=Cryphonectria parasitica (strain ATCC 38755 / EP155) TaxID=660469 RepID=A0A9P4Y4V5_CRYP1|nr:uncharacterized protein M406DRAFT_68851 [Cryphonectria parasitica EP155]KAF3766525.1 hypothetical protein M406DRAFT_68851 [Cryphonectria parasitica EP155]